MAKHVFDLSETATHQLVADRLRALADQFATGAIDLSYDEWHGPTVVVDPVDVVVDLKEQRRHVELVIRIEWARATPATT
jgi:amphi-Trp domain-containing protein